MIEDINEKIVEQIVSGVKVEFILTVLNPEIFIIRGFDNLILEGFTFAAFLDENVANSEFIRLNDPEHYYMIRGDIHLLATDQLSDPRTNIPLNDLDKEHIFEDLQIEMEKAADDIPNKKL